MIRGAGQLDRGAAADVGLTGLVNPLQQFEKILLLSLGHSFKNRFSQNASMPDQLLIGAVNHLEDELGSVQHGKKCRRLLEEICKPLHLALLLPPREDGICGFCANHQGATNFTARLVDRAIPVGPVDILDPAVSMDGHELVLVPARFASGHNRVNLRKDDRPDLGPALLALLPQGRRMLALAETWPVGVVIKLDQVCAPPQKHRVA